MNLMIYLRTHAMLTVSLGAALLSMCLIPPDIHYLGYFDNKTLSCLFCLLALLRAMREIALFPVLAQKLVQKAGSARTLVLLMVWLTALCAMLIANDMALLLFLPLCALALNTSGNSSCIPHAFILQNLSANLGGMLTPFGSPQNLYLYTIYQIPTGEFFQILALPFAFSMALLSLLCMILIPAKALQLSVSACPCLPRGRTVLYTVLFFATVLVVFRVLPYAVILILVPGALLLSAPKALRDMDWPLLGTFAAFFVFSGNLSRVPAVHTLFRTLMSENPFLTAVLSSQLISNVPAAILLSRFTEDARMLLLGVNIGGVGSLISSLANLITLQEYGKYCPSQARRFFLPLTSYHLLFLVLLTVFSLLWL